MQDATGDTSTKRDQVNGQEHSSHKRSCQVHRTKTLSKTPYIQSVLVTHLHKHFSCAMSVCGNNRVCGTKLLHNALESK